DRAARVAHFHAARQAVRRGHGDSAHLAATDVLLHLGNDADVRTAVLALTADLESVVDLRDPTLELDVDHGSDHLDHTSHCIRGLRHVYAPKSCSVALFLWPAAP